MPDRLVGPIPLEIRKLSTLLKAAKGELAYPRQTQDRATASPSSRLRCGRRLSGRASDLKVQLQAAHRPPSRSKLDGRINTVVASAWRALRVLRY